MKVKGTDEDREPTENDVVVNDEIIGTDPDPAVRAEILKNAGVVGNESGAG